MTTQLSLTPTNTLPVALAYARRGYKVFPLNGKLPVTPHGFKDCTSDAEELRRMWKPGANIGFPTGRANHIFVLDIDPRHGGTESFYQLQEKYGRFPETLAAKTGGGGTHFFLRCPENGTAIPSRPALWPGIDIKGEGGYVVLPPSRHPDTGKKYAWVDSKLKPAEAPSWLINVVCAETKDTVADPIPKKIPEGARNETLASLGGSMRRRGCGQDAILAALRVENHRCTPPLEDAELCKIAGSISRYPPSHDHNSSTTPPIADENSAEPNLLTQGFHDTGNAQRLIALFGQDLRYCPDLKRWLFWDGRRWALDQIGAVTHRVKETMALFLTQAVRGGDKEAEKFARQSLNANRINSACELAECELIVRAEDLDQHHFLLNSLNATIDLSSGALRPHSRGDYLTKTVHFNYNPDAHCDRFIGFAREIMGGSADASEAELQRCDRLMNYLQKIFGYACTGCVTEKVVFCFFGGGDNGKSTLLETIKFVLAEYSHQLMIDSLMVHPQRETNASLSDLADLKGARFVSTSEGEDGQRLAESKLKYLTQGLGQIKTVRKYENPISFETTHKLFMDSNYQPIVRGTDAAIWHRLKPIPFTVTITADRMDKTLPEKLKAEGAGILAWLVRGCLKWQQEGLNDPEEVAAANESWRAEMDPLKDFLQDCCTLQPDLLCSVAGLWQAYQRWAESQGEKQLLPRTKFIERLQRLGCSRAPKWIDGKKQRAWIGIALRQEDNETRNNGTKWNL